MAATSRRDAVERVRAGSGTVVRLEAVARRSSGGEQVERSGLVEPPRAGEAVASAGAGAAAVRGNCVDRALLEEREHLVRPRAPGEVASSTAAAAVTCGVAKLVPSAERYSSGPQLE